MGLDTAQVEQLRTDHGVYLVGGSRMNIAGLSPDIVGKLARAVASVI